MKLLPYVLALAAAITINFVLPRSMPGTPLAAIAGADISALSAADRARLTERTGLDRPLLEQYRRYLRQLLVGDLGYSYQRHAPVTTVLAERLPWTLLLVVTSQTLIWVLSLGLGAMAAWHRGQRGDLGLTTTLVMADALPTFWLAMVLLSIFAVEWPWFPLFGAESPWVRLSGLARVRDVVHHLCLPVGALTLGGLAGPFLVARTAIGSALDQPFLQAARARGLGTARLVARHAVPAALAPIVTASAVGAGLAVGGAPLVETVFSYPGIGRLLYEAVLSRDYPLLQGTFLLVTVVVLAVNALADAAQACLDPRTRSETAP